MLNNYLKVALRNIWKNKAASLISILSLVLSISFSVVLIFYAESNRQFDDFVPQVENKYRLTFDIFGSKGRNIHSSSSPAPYGPYFAENTPEIERYMRFNREQNSLLINKGRAAIKSDHVIWGDEGLLDFFGIPLLQGDENLSDNNRILISESIANRLYGDPASAIGQSLSINASRSHIVTGVFQDVPKNSSVIFETIGSIEVLQETIPWYYQNGENWGGYAFYTFFSLSKNTDLDKLTESFHQQYYDRFEIDPADLPEEYMGFDLINVADIHLHSDIDYEVVPTFSLEKIRILEILALVIAIIGWINFVNIQSARIPERLKEIGIRRSLGADLASIRLLFLSEFLVINVLALGLAFVLATFVLPTMLDAFLDVQLFTMKLGFYAAAGILLGVFASSLYPSYVAANQLTPKRIVQSFRTDFFTKLRDVFVSIQFVAALFLLTFTFIIYLQVKFMNDQETGLNEEQILVINGPVSQSENDVQKAQIFRNKLLEFSSIEQATFSTLAPGRNKGWTANLPSRDGESSVSHTVFLSNIYSEFFDVLSLEVLAGRIPSGPQQTENLPRVILNKKGAAAYNWTPEEAVGKKVGYSSDAVVVAVVADFNTVGFQEERSPMMFIYDHVFFQHTTNDYFLAKVSPKEVLSSLKDIEASYTELFSNDPFEFSFSNELFEAQYEGERQYNNLFTTFSMLSILLSLAGLVGLTSYHAIQKRKEIGIRKVLGSGELNVLKLFLSKYFKIIAVSTLLILPFIHWYTNKWLNDFASRIEIHVIHLAAPAVALVLLVMLVVSLVSLKAVRLNPVEVLKED